MLDLLTGRLQNRIVLLTPVLLQQGHHLLLPVEQRTQLVDGWGRLLLDIIGIVSNPFMQCRWTFITIKCPVTPRMSAH